MILAWERRGLGTPRPGNAELELGRKRGYDAELELGAPRFYISSNPV